MEVSEFGPVMKIIKRMMKERGLTYKDVAKKLNMSESGVKKIFLSADCSFQKILQLTRILNVRLIDILDEVHRSDPKQVIFPPAVQEAFRSDVSIFNFYVKLVIERVSIENIKKDYHLTQKDVFKYLKKLDDLKIIKLLPGDEFRLPELKLVHDFGGGPFMDHLYQSWGHDIVNDLAYPTHQAGGHFIVRCVRMRESTYQEFLTQLKNIELEFVRRGLREMNVLGESIKVMRWISLTDQNSFVPKI
jgi:transcriptional regulator with XRE-family HTH domain